MYTSHTTGEGTMVLLLIAMTSLTLALTPSQTRRDIRAPVMCSVGSALTQVNVHIQATSQSNTTAILESLAHYTGLPSTSFTLSPSGTYHLPHTASVVASGRGNALPSNEMLRITWVVGCGSVTERTMTSLQQLETDAEDGKLAAALGHDVTGWLVTNVKAGDAIKRVKRASEGSRHTRKKHRRPIDDAESSGHSDISPDLDPHLTERRQQQSDSFTQPKLSEQNKVQSNDNPMSRSPNRRTSTPQPSPADHVISAQDNNNMSDDVVKGQSHKVTKNKRPGSSRRKTTESSQATSATTATDSIEHKLIQALSTDSSFKGNSLPTSTTDQSTSTTVVLQPITTQLQTTRLSSTTLTTEETTLTAVVTSTLSTNIITTLKYITTNARTSELPPSTSNALTTTTTTVLPTVFPTTISSKVSPTTISTKVSPTTMSSKVSPTTMSSNVSPTTVSTPLPGPMIDKAPINGRLISHISMQAGHVAQYTLPESTFSDGEDGDTRQLRVRLLTHGYTVLPPSFFLQFDTASQQLYGLPLAHHTGNYSLRLVATDSVGQTAEQNIIVQVVNSRLTAHRLTVEFSATINLNYDVFANDVKKQVDIINKLATGVFGDTDASHMMVLRTQRGSTEIVWSNTTLASSTKCDVSTIRALQQMLVDGTYGGFSDSLVEAFGPYDILQVSSKPLGVCAKDAQLQHELTLLLVNEDFFDLPTTKHHKRMTSTSWPMTSSPRRQGTSSPVHGVVGNAPPMLILGLEMVGAREGQVLNRSLLANMFFDPEDGHNMQLSLNYMAGPMQSSTRAWIYVDSEQQVIQGLPFSSHVGFHEMRLIARDSGGKTAHDDFTVHVVGSGEEAQQTVAEFRLTFDDVDNHVTSDVRHQVALVHTLATRVYGDVDTSAVTVLRIVRLSSGAVQLSWTNSTFTDPRCLPSSVYALTSRLFSRDHVISARLIQALLPYTLREVRFIPHKDCVAAGMSEVTLTTGSRSKIDADAAGVSSPVLQALLAHIDAYLFIYILPSLAAIIVILLIIAIACYCRRRSEKGRGKRPAFLRNGAPIIFADELDEQPESPQRPLLVPDERPLQGGVAGTRPPGYAPLRSSPASQSSLQTCGVQSPLSGQHSVHSPPPTYRRPLVKPR